MAFPSTPLDIRTELQLNGVWSDVSGDVYVRDPKEVDHGRRDMGARADPGHLTLTFNNRDGKYSPRNPMSPLWEQIGQNTPIRVSVPGATPYVELSGDPGTFVSTPDNAALDITGDLDIRVEADINWHSPTLNQVLIAKWDAPGQRSYSLRVFDQLLNLNWSADGTTNQFAAWTLPALPPHAAVRATLDVNNGAGLYMVRLYWASSIAGPWTQFGSDRTGPATSVFSGTAPLRVGGYDPTVVPPRTPFDGKGYRFEVRDGIGGPLVAAPDFTAQPLGTVGFADSAGRTWSFSGTAHVSDRAFRFVGEISEWPKEWQPDGSDVWSSVEASGPLRRYEQGTKALHSTLRRRIPSAGPIAYWPMEEDSQASRAYSPIAGVQAAALTGVEWAAVDTLPSSLALPRLTAAATLSAIVPVAADGQWHVECVYNADDKAPPASGPPAEVLSVSATGTVRRLTVAMRAGQAYVAGYDASGTAVISSFINFTISAPFHGWHRLRIWARDNGGGTSEWNIGWFSIDGRAGQLGFVLAGVPGHVTAVTANWGALTEGWSIGHIGVLPIADTQIYDGSDSAYSGETAWDRMRRLAEEEGIPLARIPGTLQTARVGPQRPEKLVDLLQAAAAADGGMLLEDRDRIGLLYRDRSSLYTQEPALVLDVSAPGLASDDLRPAARSDSVRNDITVKRTGGSEDRAVLDEGRLSVQVPPNGIGLYDEGLELSLDDDTQMEPIAYWRLHLRTYEGAVYPAVSVMLHKPGAQVLIPAVLALHEGDLIRITNLPNYVEFGDLDLIVEGVKEKLDLHEWRVTFNCSPGTPWHTAKVGHPVYGKAGAPDTRLVANVTATATLLDVQTMAGLDWTTDPAEMPIPIAVSGEEMSVTAITQYGDTFGRTVASGWGTSDTGVLWSTSGGSAADYAVAAGVGTHTLNSVNVSRRTTATAPAADLDLTVDMAPSATATGGFYGGSLVARAADANNLYMARIGYETTGQMTLTLRKRVASTETQLATFSPGAYTAGQAMRMRFQLDGSSLRAKVWPAVSVEPVDWQVAATDTALSAAGEIGMRSITGTGNTNVAPAIAYDTFTAAGLQRFTVVRAVNGVVKGQLAGAAVRLGHPAIASL